MKKLIQILFSVMVMGFLSCNAEDVNVEVELILKNISRINITSPIESVGNFDEEGKLTTIYREDNLARELWYDSGGRYQGGTASGWIEYEENQVANIVFANDTGGSRIDVSYSGNLITEQGSDSRGIFDSNSIYEFEDETYNKLLSITVNSNLSSTAFIYHKRVFEYDIKDNLVKTIRYYYNEDTQSLEATLMREFTFDNKKNPYKKGLWQNSYVSSKVYMFFLHNSVEWNLLKQGSNNVVLETTTDLITNEIGIMTNSYIYNIDNYPSEMSSEYSWTDTVINTFFEYY